MLRFPVLVLAAAACAHPDTLTAPEHRNEAARHQVAAAAERAQFNPGETILVPGPLSTFPDNGPELQPYNPTAEHLDDADREMRAAFDHLRAAEQLEKYEDKACEGISLAERTSCPLLAPFTERVEETPQGLKLHLKATAPANLIAIQMQCHLAFSQARGFDRAPCPLYVKGVKIGLRDRAIEVRGADPAIAAEVRSEARRMFGEPPVTR